MWTLRTHRAKSSIRSVGFFRVLCYSIQQERVDHWGNNQTKKAFCPGTDKSSPQGLFEDHLGVLSLRMPRRKVSGALAPKSYVGRVPPFLVPKSSSSLDRDGLLSRTKEPSLGTEHSNSWFLIEKPFSSGIDSQLLASPHRGCPVKADQCPTSRWC